MYFLESLAEHYLEKNIGDCAFHQTHSESKWAAEMKSIQLPVLPLMFTKSIQSVNV